jgi:hypothetical protein
MLPLRFDKSERMRIKPRNHVICTFFRLEHWVKHPFTGLTATAPRPLPQKPDVTCL